MVKALRLIKEREKTEIRNLYNLQQYLRNHLTKIPGVEMNTPIQASPHIVNISVPGLTPEVMIHMLGEQKICISTISACSSKHMDESKILTACGFSKENAISALRISLSYDTTIEEITRF